MQEWETFELDSATGARLHAYVAAPESPRAVVQINHGLAEHAGRYRQFAELLASRGIAAVAHDHRGHGLTEAGSLGRGSFGGANGLDLLIADIYSVNRHIAAVFTGCPIVCFGHSLGAILAMNYCLRHHGSIAGVIIGNTSFESPAMLAIAEKLVQIERMLKGSDVPGTLARRLTFDVWNREFAPNRTPFDWLSRDAAEVDKYIADPLCGFDISVGAWLDVLRAIRAGGDRRRYRNLPRNLPFLLIAGAADPASLHGKAVEALGRKLRAAGLSDVSVTVYHDARHESLKELDRDVVMSDIACWITQRFQAQVDGEIRLP
jgi:alpha-beta hydrolase superfamily lysophospholipase